MNCGLSELNAVPLTWELSLDRGGQQGLPCFGRAEFKRGQICGLVTGLDPPVGVAGPGRVGGRQGGWLEVIEAAPGRDAEGLRQGPPEVSSAPFYLLDLPEVPGGEGDAESGGRGPLGHPRLWVTSICTFPKTHFLEVSPEPTFLSLSLNPLAWPRQGLPSGSECHLPGGSPASPTSLDSSVTHLSCPHL